MLIKFLCSFILLLSAGLGHSQSAPQPPNDDQSLTGVWQGKLGDLPITICFNPRQYGSQRGSYFYHRHLEPIVLDGDGAQPFGYFDERSTEGGHRWKLQVEKDPSRATGTWTKNQKPNTAPQVLNVSLERVKGGEYVKDHETKDRPCGTDAFFRKLDRPLPLIKGKVQLFEGKPFQVIRRALKGTGEVSSIELLAEDEKYKKLNLLLAKDADGRDLFECLRGGLWSGTGAGHNSSFNQIKLWGDRWLVVSFSTENYCGGAHPNSWSSDFTFDLRTSRKANLSAWFKGLKNDSGERYNISPQITLGKSLHKLVRSYSQAFKDKNEDCLNSFESYNSHSISLTKQGISFSPVLARVVQACGEDIVVPYSKLTPFLSPLGKQEVEQLQAGVF
jgi:hypothetical protein